MPDMPQHVDSASARRWTADILWGMLAGAIIGIGFGVAHVIATALEQGAILGLDASLTGVQEPQPAIIPGIFVSIAAALLWYARSLWWSPLLGRAVSILIPAVMIVVGHARFSTGYWQMIGMEPWWIVLPTNTSQSMLLYAYVGVAALSVIAELVRKRTQRIPDEQSGSPVNSQRPAPEPT